MYLKGVTRASTILIAKENSIIIGVSKPKTVCTAATSALSSGTTPEIPNAELNIVLKGTNAVQIKLEPAERIKNPKIVFMVP